MRFVYLILTLLYVFSPYDIIPDIILGLGWLDDLLILFFLFRYLSSFKAKSSFFFKYPKSESSTENPFSVLGIKASSSPKAIRAAYIKLVNKYHPDKFVHMGIEKSKIAEAHFIKIQEAYDQLKILGKV